MAKERDNRQKQREALEKEEEELSAQVVKLKDTCTHVVIRWLFFRFNLGPRVVWSRYKRSYT